MKAVETQEVNCHEVSSATHGVRKSTSLLGPSGSGMRLRVSRDKPRTSDIVELASRKCLVGSAPSCHVRVNEPGVAPIECLIFHGSKSNVVRWLAASRELAGGEPFEDEVLLAGDPLQIGPVELELLVDEILSAEEPRGTQEMPATGEDRLAEYMLRLERLEIQLVELQQASELTSSLADAPTNSDLNDEVAATINDLSAQLADLQSRGASDRELWAGNRAELEALQSRLREFDFLRDEVQRLHVELGEVRSEFGNRAANEDADEIQGELEVQRRQFDDQHQSRCEASLDDQVMDQPNAAYGQLPDREISEPILNPIDRLLAGSSLVDDRRDGAADPLRDFLAFKPAIRDDADSENQDDDYSDSGYGRGADVASNYYEQAFSGLRPAAYLDDATADDDTVENLLFGGTETGGYGQRFESVDAVIDEGEDVAFETASSAPPASTADVLARLGQAGAGCDDGTVADGSSDAPVADAGDSPDDLFAGVAGPETVEPESGQPPHRPFHETPFAPSTPDATGGSDDDEESIEAYMARLMNRVRGTDDRDEPASQVPPTVERSPVTEYTEVVKSPQPESEPEAEKFGPEVYRPRSQAPELADRMTAMRSLANDSARTAIASHAKRNWSSIMKLKLFVSVFAFVSVVVSIIFFWGDPLLMGLGSLVGVGVLAYWTRIAITYRIMLLDSLMLDPDGSDGESTCEDDVA